MPAPWPASPPCRPGFAAAAALLFLVAAAPSAPGEAPRDLTPAEAAALVGGGEKDPIACCETIDACEPNESCDEGDHDDDPTTPERFCGGRRDEVPNPDHDNIRGCGYSSNPWHTCEQTPPAEDEVCLYIYSCVQVGGECLRLVYHPVTGEEVEPQEQPSPGECNGFDCPS